MKKRPPADIALQHAVASPWRLALQVVHTWPVFALSPLALVCAFAVLIGCGAVVLSLPLSAADGIRTGFVDSLFTSASSVCVTGLVVVDTGTHWSLFGQAVVLLLIQVGGFGFMASATLLFLAFGRHIGLRERLLLGETIGVSTPGGLVSLIRRIALFTLVAELVGAAVLLARFAQQAEPGRAAWMALFQSISAFNNAGFDIFGDFASLTGMNTDVLVVSITGILVVVGGLSYVVLANVAGERRFSRLRLDSKMVLVTSGALLLVGSIAFLLAESGNPETLGPLSWPHKALCGIFQAVTPRTAGFTTVPVAGMHDYTLLFTMFLMLIGGASGSTAGGIKVGTFGILVAAVLDTLRGHEHADAFGREFNVQHVYRALSVVLLSLSFVGVVILLLVLTEEGSVLDVAFEAVSAFGTVGLSTGITPGLSLGGRLIVTLTMFVGRLGPLYLALALVQGQSPREFRYPVESVRIG